MYPAGVLVRSNFEFCCTSLEVETFHLSIYEENMVGYLDIKVLDYLQI